MKNEDEVKDFPHQLDKWTTEEVAVPTKTYDPNTGTVKTVERMEKMQVKYIHAPKEHYRCKRGTHVLRVLDNARYIFGCTKCQFARKIYPTTYRVTDEGYIIHKITGERV